MYYVYFGVSHKVRSPEPWHGMVSVGITCGLAGALYEACGNKSPSPYCGFGVCREREDQVDKKREEKKEEARTREKDMEVDLRAEP